MSFFTKNLYLLLPRTWKYSLLVYDHYHYENKFKLNYLRKKILDHLGGVKFTLQTTRALADCSKFSAVILAHISRLMVLKVWSPTSKINISRNLIEM